MHLAKLEMSIFWKMLLPRFDSVELAGAPMKSQSIFISGLKSLPIRYRLR
jgi:cytochrome P450